MSDRLHKWAKGATWAAQAEWTDDIPGLGASRWRFIRGEMQVQIQSFRKWTQWSVLPDHEPDDIVDLAVIPPAYRGFRVVEGGAS